LEKILEINLGLGEHARRDVAAREVTPVWAFLRFLLQIIEINYQMSFQVFAYYWDVMEMM